MRTRILTLAALILALENSVVAGQTLPASLKIAPAATVVGRILAGRDQLGLNPEQVARLAKLEQRLQHDRGRPVVTGLDRAPGKSVPRIERVKTSATGAYRQALRVLRPDQQATAARLLDTFSR